MLSSCPWMSYSGTKAERKERWRSTGGERKHGHVVEDGGEGVYEKVDVDVDVDVGMGKSVSWYR